MLGARLRPVHIPRARGLLLESRRVAVPMIGLQTRLVVVGPRRCSTTGGGRLGWRRAGSAENGGKLESRAGSIHVISVPYAAIVSPAPGILGKPSPCALLESERHDSGCCWATPLSCAFPAHTVLSAAGRTRTCSSMDVKHRPGFATSWAVS